MENDNALTPLEVAQILKISKNTVYELIKRGELNSYRVGKKVRVDMSDIEEYKDRTKSRNSSGTTKNSTTKTQSTKLIMSKNNNVEYEEVQKTSDFVICGQDIILDILARYLEMHSNGVQALRAYNGSYNGLCSLYHNKVSIATAHMWDGDKDEYNISYVKSLLPGTPAVIVNLAYRMQGFYVAKENPKNIRTWEDLIREDITIINRERGSGTRILLDEHLKKLGVTGSNIKGYDRECTSHIAVASTVARGSADIGIGNEKASMLVDNIDFIPMQKERYDLVIKKEDLSKPQFQAVFEIINSQEFCREISGIGGYGVSDTGKIVAET